VSWGEGRLDIFAIGSDDQLYAKSWTGSAWLPSQVDWSALGGPLANDPTRMLPFWRGDTIFDESLLMVAADGGAAEAALLCPASEIRAVRDALLGTRYTPGIDWIYDDATNRLRLPAGSHAAFLDATQLESAGAPLFAEGHYFHAHQLAVTYRHGAACWSGPRPEPRRSLSGTRAKLAAGGRVTLAIVGDSISAGYDASGFATSDFPAVAPYMKPWPELLAQDLRSRFAADVALINPSKVGETANSALQIVHDSVSVRLPDLVVVALGMNDGSGNVPAADFENAVRAILADVRASNPACEFILAAPMLANPAWSSAGDQRPYLEVLTRIASAPGIALADMTSTHSQLLARKRYLDMTGNGLNHPNDFLSRWYAQLVAGLL
jgi:lysophospholipase L1-like esterase